MTVTEDQPGDVPVTARDMVQELAAEGLLDRLMAQAGEGGGP